MLDAEPNMCFHRDMFILSVVTGGLAIAPAVVIPTVASASVYESAQLSTQAVTPRSAQPAAASLSWSASLDSAITAELKRTGTPDARVAVVVGGTVAYSKGFGVTGIETHRAVTEHTLFRVGSVSKMVTAAVLSELATNGSLDMQAPISTYVPELNGKRVGAVTTHQLLTHSAGWLDNAVAYGRMGEGALGEVFREITDTMFFTEPGRIFSYSNPGYSMAGYIAEGAAGFLFASAGEIARFSMALMNNGMLDGVRVLSTDAVTRMTTGYLVVPGQTNTKYGYGLNIVTAPSGLTWQHGGSINGFDALVTMFPSKKVSVIVLDNLSGSPLQGITELVASQVAHIARGLRYGSTPIPA